MLNTILYAVSDAAAIKEAGPNINGTVMCWIIIGFALLATAGVAMLMHFRK